MSVKSYRGNRGKNIYEINNFSRGINNTNASINNGQVKEMVNFRISPDGMSLRPREPFINYTFFIREDNNNIYFPRLSDSIGIFTSKQFPNKEFIVDLRGERKEVVSFINKDTITVVDGDTFYTPNNRYRLLMIDTPEYGEEGFEEARSHLQRLIDESDKGIEIYYDPQAPSWVDAFGRHLVWAISDRSVNINKDIYEDPSTKTKLLDKVVTAHKFGDLSTWIKGPTILNYPGHNVVVYERNLNENPYLIGTEDNKFVIHTGDPEENLYRPAYRLEQSFRVYMGVLTNDLNMGYSTVPNISINRIKSEHRFFSTEYNPLIINEMPNFDGVVLLGSVKRPEDNIVNTYSGLMSIDLEIPLTEDENRPDFEKYFIKVSSYRKNIREIKFEDLGRHSQNLLDSEPILHDSYFGEAALENGYSYPTIRTFMFSDIDGGDMYSQLQRNKEYAVIPLIALPKFDYLKNGFDPEEYDGYAYKWEVIIHNKTTSDSGEEVVQTIDWAYAINDDGSIPDITEKELKV